MCYRMSAISLQFRPSVETFWLVSQSVRRACAISSSFFTVPCRSVLLSSMFHAITTVANIHQHQQQQPSVAVRQLLLLPLTRSPPPRRTNELQITGEIGWQERRDWWPVGRSVGPTGGRQDADKASWDSREWLVDWSAIRCCKNSTLHLIINYRRPARLISRPLWRVPLIVLQ